MNSDVVTRIALFIEPDPVEYARLSLVCREFYNVFTSDPMWKYLDPLGHEHDIFSKFLARCSPHELEDVCDAWTRRVSRPRTAEPLAWLAYYTSSSSFPTICPTTRQMIWCALNISHYAIYHIDPHTVDRKCALAAVRTYGPALTLLPRRFWKDRQVIEVACSRAYYSFCALEFADAALREDRELVAKAVFQDGIAMDFASPRLRQDREFVLECVKYSGEAIEFTDFFSDREIVQQAVLTFGQALKHAVNFQDDDSIVESALRQDGLALRYASKRLLYNRQLVLIAVQQNPAALNYAPHFCSDREILLHAIRNSFDAFAFASPSLRHDRNFILTAVAFNAWCLYRIPIDYLHDREVLLAAIDQNGELYTHLPAFRDDKEFYRRAIKTYPSATLWAPKALAS